MNVQQCLIHNCSWINATTYSTTESTTKSYNTNITSEIFSIISSNQSLSSIMTSTITGTATAKRNLLYGDHCTDHEECLLSRRLFCQYGFDLDQKHCLCETAYFWNKNTQQCG